MKTALLINSFVILGLASSVFAINAMPKTLVTSSDAGIYMGLQGGLGMTNWQNLEGYQDTLDDALIVAQNAHGSNGFVSRIFIGYDINKYFALESGFSYFFRQAYFTLTEDGVLVDSFKIRTMILDLFGKGKLPIFNKVDLYAKLGANLAMRHWPGLSNANNINVTFGAGVDYYITSNVIVNLEWLRFNGYDRVSDIEKYQPHADTFMLGLRYKFDL